MLRLLIWGETAREQEQAKEILRLHAQLVDLQDKYHQAQQKASGDLQQAYNEFMSFLRPQAIPSGSQPASESARELPGDRPSTAPLYPAKPIWADQEVPTAVPV